MSSPKRDTGTVRSQRGVDEVNSEEGAWVIKIDAKGRGGVVSRNQTLAVGLPDARVGETL